MPILHCNGIIFIKFLLKTNKKKQKKLFLRANTTGISKENLFSEHGIGGYSIPPVHCKVVCHSSVKFSCLSFSSLRSAVSMTASNRES